MTFTEMLVGMYGSSILLNRSNELEAVQRHSRHRRKLAELAMSP